MKFARLPVRLSRASVVARLFVSGACLVGVACGGPSAEPAAGGPPSPAQPATAALAEACTIETPLVPGVPGSPGHLIPSDITPNGQSELAHTMRTMQQDLGAARAAVLAGRAVAPMFDRHRKMRCAWPTTPSDRNPVFDGFAVAYLARVQALDAAPAGEGRMAYEGVLDACKACHSQSCPGPIAAIEALRLPAP